jgi:protein SCO1/2
MDRRRYLGSIAASGLAFTAGCLGTIPGIAGNKTVLDAPEQDLSASAHPSHGDEFPELTLRDPLVGEDISTATLEGDRGFLTTFFYTNCPNGMCPALILRLRRAQAAAAEGGYGDQAAFIPITFDPERDTAEALEAFAAEQGVDLDAGNWHFLRPDSYDSGQTLIDEEFGLKIEKVDAQEYENLEYTFPHYNLILLANDRGIVERAYPNAIGGEYEIDEIVEDFETVVTA